MLIGKFGNLIIKGSDFILDALWTNPHFKPLRTIRNQRQARWNNSLIASLIAIYTSGSGIRLLGLREETQSVSLRVLL
jgi:hypothetical protein